MSPAGLVINTRDEYFKHFYKSNTKYNTKKSVLSSDSAMVRVWLGLGKGLDVIWG